MTRSPRNAREAASPRVLVETDRAIPLVDVDLVVRGGSAQDPIGREGLARLHARLLRRGTLRRALPNGTTIPARSADTLEEAIESLGGALSIDVSSSAVRLHGSVIRRNLEPFFALLASLLTAPALRKDELAYVRREVEAELVAQLDNDRWLAARAFRHALFGGHAYGRSTTGTPRSLAAITLAEIRAHHEATVRGDAVIVAFAGDVAEAEARALVDAHLGDLSSGAPLPAILDDPPSPRGTHIVVVDKPDRTQTQLFIGTLGARMGDRSFYPLLVANTVFGGTFSARLVAEVRSKRGWSYGAQSRLYADRARDAWSVYTHPSIENARDCVALELDLIERFVLDGVRARELSFAKSYLVRSHAFDRDTAAKRLEPYVESSLFGLPLAFFLDYVGHVSAVTLDDASRVVRSHLGGPSHRGTDRVVAILGPAAQLERSLASLPGVTSIRVVAHGDVASL
ncbi:MAG: insulinase family protein [Deltaproteobacteria bacterium]|nr:insulinase family protein [Deltaproteobacteria bacterium]